MNLLKDLDGALDSSLYKSIRLCVIGYLPSADILSLLFDSLAKFTGFDAALLVSSFEVLFSRILGKRSDSTLDKNLQCRNGRVGALL